MRGIMLYFNGEFARASRGGRRPPTCDLMHHACAAALNRLSGCADQSAMSERNGWVVAAWRPAAGNHGHAVSSYPARYLHGVCLPCDRLTRCRVRMAKRAVAGGDRASRAVGGGVPVLVAHGRDRRQRPALAFRPCLLYTSDAADD